MALVTERDLIRTLSSKRGVDFLMNSMQYELEAEDAMSRVRSLLVSAERPTQEAK